MIEEFKKLKQEEIDILLKAPALASVMGVSGEAEVNKDEKADAIRLSHLKTFTAHPMLLPYYAEVEKNFKENFEALINKYSPFDDAKREALRKEVHALNRVITKLDKEYAMVLHSSLSGYADHVRKAGHGIMEDFVFPIPLRWIND